MNPLAWRDTRALVTGGSGFIGTHLVEALHQAGARVTNVDVAPPKVDAYRTLWRCVDIRDKAALRQVVADAQPTHVLHLAARVDLDGRSPADYDTNTDGTANVISALGAAPQLRHASFCSSMLVCRPGHVPRSELDYQPGTAYGRSKVAMEKIVRSAHLGAPWILVRPTSIWGPWFGEPYRSFFTAVLAGRYANPSGRTARKTIGYVANTVAQLLSVVVAGERYSARTFYLGDAPPVSVAEWAAAIRQAARLPPVRTVPVAAFRAAATTGDILRVLGVTFPMTSYRLRNLLNDNVLDVSPAQQACGEPIVTLAEGVRRTLHWLQTQAGGNRPAQKDSELRS